MLPQCEETTISDLMDMQNMGIPTALYKKTKDGLLYRTIQGGQVRMLFIRKDAK